MRHRCTGVAMLAIADNRGALRGFKGGIAGLVARIEK
jgi:hypothetical protein